VVGEKIELSPDETKGFRLRRDLGMRKHFTQAPSANGRRPWAGRARLPGTRSFSGKNL